MDITKTLEQLKPEFTGTTASAPETAEKKDSSETVNPKITVIEHSDFDKVVETALKTTHELGTEANQLFMECFNDYEGCIIEPTPDPFNPFRLRLFFTIKNTEGDENKINCLEKVGMSKGDNAFQRLSNFNIMQKNKTYNITDKAKEVLSDFIVVPQGKKINWNQVSIECSSGGNIYGRAPVIFMAITIDLLRFIKVVYGTKDKNGSRVDYQIMNIRPLGETPAAQPNYFGGYQQNMIPNFLVGIMKLNSDNLKSIASKIGWIPQDTNGIPMIKAQ